MPDTGLQKMNMNEYQLIIIWGRFEFDSFACLLRATGLTLPPHYVCILTYLLYSERTADSRQKINSIFF